MLFSRKSESRKDQSPNDQSPEPDGFTGRVPEDRRPVSQLPGAQIGGGSTHIQSFIDASLTILGDLHSEGDVRIDGRICGNVRCAQLIVSPGAVITGAVIADAAIVRGKITGTIRADAVVIQDTAHVESEIVYSQIAIDDGAIFEGSARHSDNPLEEVTVTPLAELQHEVTGALETAPVAAPAPGTTKPGNSRDADVDTPTAVVDAPVAAGGKPNGRAPAVNGHNPPG